MSSDLYPPGVTGGEDHFYPPDPTSIDVVCETPDCERRDIIVAIEVFRAGGEWEPADPGGDLCPTCGERRVEA